MGFLWSSIPAIRSWLPPGRSPSQETRRCDAFTTNVFLDRFARDMTFQTAKVQTMNITDWDSFHSVFAETMGFPEFYGRNMDAWIDCMTGFDDGMTRFAVPPGELFHLEVADTKDFARRVPEIFQAFIECAAFVNWRRVEQGERPVLSLILL